MLLEAHPFEMPWDTSGDGERDKFSKALIEELPAFLYWLDEKYNIPAKFRDQRYGVKSYHNHRLAGMLNYLTPEMQLLRMIDEVLWQRKAERLFEKSAPPHITEKWTGTAEELRNILYESRPVKIDAKKLLDGWQESCGTYLGRLERKKSHRVSKDKRKSDRRGWIITPPLESQ